MTINRLAIAQRVCRVTFGQLSTKGFQGSCHRATYLLKSHDRLYSTKRHVFKASCASYPKSRNGHDDHDEKRQSFSNRVLELEKARTGEDSYAIRSWDKGLLSGTVLLSIADGVGGWASVPGIDPATFSHALSHEVADIFMSLEPNGNDEHLQETDSLLPDPKHLIHEAYSNLARQGIKYAGGSTICTGMLNPLTATLSIANLGDSGFIVIRRGKPVLRSLAQTHGFNTPYQLSIIPRKISNKGLISDSAVDADAFKFTVQHGDVILLATDGLTDNLFLDDIVSTVTARMLKDQNWKLSPDGEKIVPDLFMSSPTELCRELVTKGVQAANDSERETPFSQEMNKAYNAHYQQKNNNVTDGTHTEVPFVVGGKVDDITLVAAIVEAVSAG